MNEFIIETISKKLRIAKEEITPDKKLSELGADSLDIAELAMELAMHLGLDLDAFSDERIDAVQDLIDFDEKHSNIRGAMREFKNVQLPQSKYDGKGLSENRLLKKVRKADNKGELLDIARCKDSTDNVLCAIMEKLPITDKNYDDEKVLEIYKVIKNHDKIGQRAIEMYSKMEDARERWYIAFAQIR